ncbi:hypothetical protein AMK59_3798, partial [Oryctes borbonicus]
FRNYQKMDTSYTKCQILFSFVILQGSMALVATTDLSNSHKQNSRCDVTSLNMEDTIFCPSLREYVAEITLRFGSKIMITCNDDVRLANFQVNVGEVHNFDSKDCNLVDQLGEIFTKWNIKGVAELTFDKFSYKEFVLQKRQFENVNVSEVRAIYMHRSNMIGIDADTFRNFINLETISLRWNSITTFPDLSYLRKVKVIDFSSNKITTVPDQLNLPSLRTLLLTANQLITFNEPFFANMSALSALELRNNNIKYLPEKLLHPLTGLKALGLCDLIEIPNGFFKTNQALNRLMFYSGNLSSISENVFLNLSNLTVLSLTGTSLETLPENLFVNQMNLRELRLQNYRFEALPANIFRNLQSLEFLQIFGTQLQKWHFPNQLHRLKTLDLSLNQLTGIQSNFSDNMPRLEQLGLSGNKISYIGETAFKNFRLKKLNLSYNSLSDNAVGTTFMNQTNTDELNLAHNAYESVPHIHQGRIKQLNMEYNKIRRIDTLPSISCDLSHNAIKSISLSMSNQFQAMGNKVNIKINANPIDCGCDVFPLVQYFDGSYSNKNIYQKVSLDGTRLKCHGPENMTGITVKSMKSDTFSCVYKDTYSCSEECSCQLHPHQQIFSVTCSGRNLSASPVIPQFTSKMHKYATGFDSMFTINKLVVDLSNNSIRNFTGRDSSYVNVSELNLSDNELDLVDWLPPKLEVLRLNDNKLQNLGYEAIVALNESKTLRNLTLHRNLWNCDCELLNFTDLVRTRYLKIPFEDSILCADGRKAMKLLEDDLCSFDNRTSLIVIGVCIFILFLLSSIATVLFKKHEQRLKVWMYGKSYLMHFVRENDLDKDKPYDAFVSFSHEDENFVGKELVPLLENGPDPYKLCIHARDWIVGEHIDKQIVDSVEKSRRTIVVLSQHFLRSEWAIMEFKTAHEQAMREGRHRLIVILYGDIDSKSIQDENLQHYLTTNTYLEWRDPSFSEKLKSALPHKKDKKNAKNEDSSKNKNTKLMNKKVEHIMLNIDKMDLINSPMTPDVITPAVSLDPLLIRNRVFQSNSYAETSPAGCEFVANSVHQYKTFELVPTTEKVYTHRLF